MGEEARERLATYKCPRRVVVVEKLPRNAMGKIERSKHAAKTGLAAVVSFYLARFLELPESYWAAISAIIVMYSDVSRTVKASGYRLVGTAIGVSIVGDSQPYLGSEYGRSASL